ncbi:MAG TPA: aminotransferase class I/II-fold pyridoxal phosphate-dependent enzyme [Acidimicrobiales bacterium]|nr:aminotransferase class I/II-fold pyridoxal phosphate-dependent enzyme [Acidimicrobiales bacterium]
MTGSDRSPLSSLDLTLLRRRTSEKWRHYPDDVLPLWVAEMDVPLAEAIERALVEATEIGDLGYAIAEPYVEALAGFAARHWGWNGVDVSLSRPVANVMSGVAAAISVLTGPGDSVVVNCPVYPPFYSYVENSGRVVDEAPLDAAGRLDLAALEAAFARARKRSERPAYLLCSPHNPTGTLHRREELADALELATRYGLRVISDEIHAPLVLRGTFTPLLSLDGAEQAVAILSASKAFNLAGAPAAVLVAGEDAHDVIDALGHRVVPGPSHLGVIAQSAALNGADEWLAALLSDLRERQGLLVDLLATHLPDARYQPGAATYLAWLDVGDLGLPASSEESRGQMTNLSGPAAFFLEHARVALSDGSAFGTGGAGHVRLNFATTETILTEALERLGHSLGAPEHSSVVGE